MKKKNFNSKLSLQKAQVADLNSSMIHGGRPPKTFGCRTETTAYFKCSDVNCYTNIDCYHTETCQVPVTGIGC